MVVTFELVQCFNILASSIIQFNIISYYNYI